MILYYSGTGNSRYVAESLSAALDDGRCFFLPHVAAEQLVCPADRLIFCFPVYSWGVPPFVLEYIDRFTESLVAELRETKVPVIAVITAGDEVARTPEMLERKLRDKGLRLAAVWSVIMPNDYVLLPGFDVDSREVEMRKLAESRPRISHIADCIMRGRFERDVVVGSWPRLKTALVYPLFKRWGINPARWKASDACIGCGRCVRSCPVGNIHLSQQRPEWGRNCLSCTACYQVCPVQAVSYGSFTKGKGQYYCPESQASMKQKK
ncbi:MAG: EFR1 family ferrodoxin [Muribaculaceae bacterium]|nr:EFR1 family ferrodoxin [Muribaculaceae bacterium]